MTITGVLAIGIIIGMATIGDGIIGMDPVLVLVGITGTVQVGVGIPDGDGMLDGDGIIGMETIGMETTGVEIITIAITTMAAGEILLMPILEMETDMAEIQVIITQTVEEEAILIRLILQPEAITQTAIPDLIILDPITLETRIILQLDQIHPIPIHSHNQQETRIQIHNQQRLHDLTLQVLVVHVPHHLMVVAATAVAVVEDLLAEVAEDVNKF